MLHRTYFETFLLSDDQTRVKLRRGSGDYINANFVNVREKQFFIKAVLLFLHIFVVIYCVHRMSHSRSLTMETRHRASTSMYLANILRSHYVARTPPVEARGPGCRSNVENAPVTRRSPASSARRSRGAFALCHHITGWKQACT